MNNLSKLLKAWLRDAEKQMPKQHRQKTPDCLNLKELEDYLSGRLTDREHREHITNCEYCKKMVAIALDEIKPKDRVRIVVGKNGNPVIKSVTKGVEIIKC